MVTYLPLVGLRAVRAVFLNMHTKEADICSVNVLECKKGFCSVWERLWHLSAIHKSGNQNMMTFSWLWRMYRHKKIVSQILGARRCLCLCILLLYLDFMPGLTSTTLSETWTTRIKTSPASGWVWRFKKSFTLVSRKLPNFVWGNPVWQKSRIISQNGDQMQTCMFLCQHIIAKLLTVSLQSFCNPLIKQLHMEL